MNPIKITKLQMVKLEEMIKIYFPEFKYVKVDEYQIDTGGAAVRGVSARNRWPVFVYMNETDTIPRDGYRCIPWFEFCLTHLAPKMEDKNYCKPDGSVRYNAMSPGHYCLDTAEADNNPIDYLWEEQEKYNEEKLSKKKKR